MDGQIEERRVMVAGKLEMIRHSSRAFTLILASGAPLDGIAISEQVTPANLAALFGEQVLVSGVARFRPSGALLMVEVDRIEAAAEQDVAIFSFTPTSFQGSLHPCTVTRPQTPTTGVGAFFGTWPGDETDEELLAALAELS